MSLSNGQLVLSAAAADLSFDQHSLHARITRLRSRTLVFSESKTLAAELFVGRQGASGTVIFRPAPLAQFGRKSLWQRRFLHREQHGFFQGAERAPTCTQPTWKIGANWPDRRPGRCWSGSQLDLHQSAQAVSPLATQSTSSFTLTSPRRLHQAANGLLSHQFTGIYRQHLTPRNRCAERTTTSPSPHPMQRTRRCGGLGFLTIASEYPPDIQRFRNERRIVCAALVVAQESLCRIPVVNGSTPLQPGFGFG